MQAACVLRTARRRAGLGLRGLAERAGTSHATLHAYESGRVQPRVDTLTRIAAAAGFDIEVALRSRPDADGREERARELTEALALAAAFPARHQRTLRAPVFGREGT